MANELKRNFISDIVIVAKIATGLVPLVTFENRTHELIDYGNLPNSLRSSEASLVNHIITMTEGLISNTQYGQIGIVVPDSTALKFFMIQGAFNAEGVGKAKNTYRTANFEWLQGTPLMVQLDRFVELLKHAKTSGVTLAIATESSIKYNELHILEDYMLTEGETIHLESFIDEDNKRRISKDKEKEVECKNSTVEGDFIVKTAVIAGTEKFVIDRTYDEKYLSEIEAYNISNVLDYLNARLPKYTKLKEGELKAKEGVFAA